VAAVETEQAKLRPLVEDLREVASTLDPTTGKCDGREAEFHKIRERLSRSELPMRQTMAATMMAFAPGLFVGGDDPDLPRDNLELERFFRCPKGHERRIHGRRHAGVRIVQEGPTLLPTLDAHLLHPAPFAGSELLPYACAPVPNSQQGAQRRRRIMRAARSRKRRPLLLRQLETRYHRLI
jgi:hypothetical protein